MSHFDEMTVMLYLDGQMETERAGEMFAHLGTCGECRALLRALDNEGARLHTALTEHDEAVPARLVEPPARARLHWGWLAGLGLASAGCYAIWNVMIEPWEQRISQAGFSGGNVLTMIFFQGALWNGWGMLRSAMESFALAAIAITVLVLFRRVLRRRAIFAVVILALASAGMMARPAAAATEVKHGNPDYYVASGEVLHSDLIVFGNVVTIDGTVDGDVIVWAQILKINGHVTGDVIMFGRELRLNGPVDGNVRNWDETVTIENIVGKNVTSWCAHVDLDGKGHIGGSMLFGAGDSQLDGYVERDVMGWTGSTEINGTLGGATTLTAEDLDIGSRAQLRGPVVYRGKHPPQVATGAKLASAVDFRANQGEQTKYATGKFYLHQAVQLGAAFLFGLLIALLMPGFFGDVARATRQVGRSMGIGLVTLIVGLILAIMAVVLVFFGVTAPLVTTVLLLPAIYAAQVFVGFWIGEIILGRSAGSGAILGRLALGLLLIRVLGNLPVVGALLWLAVVLWGVGALVLAIHRGVREKALPAQVAD